eukprot:gene18988-20896_t
MDKQQNGRLLEQTGNREFNNIVFAPSVNIYFVLGGAAYYHRGHLKEFLLRLESTNFLHTSIAGDIENPIYLAVWLQLKLKLEDYGSNASPLLDKECPIADACLTKDEVFEELFRETHDSEFDALTQECLEIVQLHLCSCHHKSVG